MCKLENRVDLTVHPLHLLRHQVCPARNIAGVDDSSAVRDLARFIQGPEVPVPVGREPKIWFAKQAILVWLASFGVLIILSTVQAWNIRIGLVVSEVGLALPPLLYMTFKKYGIEALGIRTHAVPRNFVRGLAIGPLTFVAGTLIAGMLIYVFPPPSWYLEAFTSITPTSLPDLAIWMILMSAVVAPCEEILSRGLVQQGMEMRYGKRIGLVYSSILFGVLHLDPWRSPATAVMGLVVGYLYQKQGYNLLAPIGAHAANNCIALIVAYSFR